MQNAPALQNQNSIAKLFENPALKKQLSMAIPKHMSVDRLLRVAMTALRVNPKLMECTQQSLLACVMGCAQLGLEPEPFLGQAYLIPFKKNKKGQDGKWQSTMECQLIPGYRGYIALARRSGELQSLSAQVVYENDEFDLRFGLEEKLDHRPAEGDRGEVKGAYVVFRYKDGIHSFDYMSKEDIDKIRERSKSKDDGPWVTDYPEMAKKTVIRRHVKVAPLSVELAKAVISEDLALSGESQVDMFLPDSQREEEKPVEKTFEELAAECNPEDAILFDRCLAETAKITERDIEGLKRDAATSFAGFLQHFKTWKAKQPAKTDLAPGTCPNLEGVTPKVSECEECEKREGCPTWT